jgi:ferric-dicitrate binding protein FerR (iron transport regulator)
MNSSARLLELAALYSHGTVTADELHTLEGALRNDAAFRKQFLRYLNVDSVLGGMAPLGTSGTSVLSSVAVGNRRNVAFAMAGIVAAVAVAVSIWWQRSVPRNLSDTPIAVVTAMTNARWADPNVELALNSGEMPSGPLRLTAGRVEFFLADGATAVVQGPAEFRFAERKRIVVTQGRIVCSCPTPESRVTVVTPETEIVDLGTVFSVEARPDQSTRVAVLRGEVEVKGTQPQRLRQGDVAEVTKTQVIRLDPLSAEESERLAGLWQAEFLPNADMPNRLLDPGMEQGLASKLWHGTAECLEATPTDGRSGAAIRIRAHSHRFWPLVKQDLNTGDISGKLVAASVWGATPGDDRLSGRQHAVLKLAFIDAEGREFACATRRFLNAGSIPDRFEQATVAAKAPTGASGVQVQLILNATGLKSGSIIFDDASLMIGNALAALPIP